MIGREAALARLERALELSRAQQTQANLVAEELELTRFNANSIHQNLSRHTLTLTIKAVEGRRSGTAATNLLDDDSLRSTAEQALLLARLGTPGPNPVVLPAPRPTAAVAAYSPATAAFTPAERADWCGAVIGCAVGAGLEAAGTFSTEVREVAVANSVGVRAYHHGTRAYMRTIMTHGDNTGYADRLEQDVTAIDPEALAREALGRAVLRPDVRDLEPGQYDTVFEEYAVADLIRFFGYLCFGALAKQEGRSFMARRMGEKVLGANVTIWDDGLDQRGLAMPFDAEGVPKQKVVFIDRGVACGVVYDSFTAAREGRESTGHAGGHYTRGGMPANMLMATGETDRHRLIATTKRGVLVTRFHYTHCPEPMRVVATGTTRDGTFLIEDGNVVARLRNLRFTESLLEAFNRIEGITPGARLTRDWWSTFESVLPALKIGGFTFTGSTTF